MTRQDRTADTLRDPDSIESLRSAILTSDAIVIGAGSGLSTAAGFLITASRELASTRRGSSTRRETTAFSKAAGRMAHPSERPMTMRRW